NPIVRRGSLQRPLRRLAPYPSLGRKRRQLRGYRLLAGDDRQHLGRELLDESGADAGDRQQLALVAWTGGRDRVQGAVVGSGAGGLALGGAEAPLLQLLEERHVGRGELGRRLRRRLRPRLAADRDRLRVGQPLAAIADVAAAVVGRRRFAIGEVLEQ